MGNPVGSKAMTSKGSEVSSRRSRLLAGLLACLALGAAGTLLLAWKTVRDLCPPPESLSLGDAPVRKMKILDRSGIPLSVTYINHWNLHDALPLRDVPELLLQAFIVSEDKRFFEHQGVDWQARGHALWQNVKALKAVRGASTITEQTVRMLHPRPRTLWSRWLEGIEAHRLERRFSKAEILEFYLNQVPYAHRRRGVVQAARLYFDRDPDTLSAREMLALAVLVRAPSSFDLRRGGRGVDGAVRRLAANMKRRGTLTEDQYRSAVEDRIELREARPPVDATHFVQHLHRAGPEGAALGSTLVTTLDAALQERVRHILDSRLRDLRSSDIGNGAVLVVDHRSDEVLAWVNGGAMAEGAPGAWIDGVTTPRQPGSTLKPFLYALALEMGWTPATLIDDSPVAQAVGSGLHNFHNYSRTYYGPLRLREALANSLNVPAIRAIQFTGTERFLGRLRLLGFQSLAQPADFYGQGLALGDGEVSLFELVRAYAVLARQGEYRPLRTIRAPVAVSEPPRRVFAAITAALIGDILSDPQARRLEFGDGNLLRLPVQTAVKTGTSTDHRDSWIVGFSSRYTVGVWMGNLDRGPTKGVTGLAGPGLVLRAVFAELNRYGDAAPLPPCPGLAMATICAESGLPAGPHCPGLQEWFEPGTVPTGVCSIHERPGRRDCGGVVVEANRSRDLRLQQPTPGLRLAMDPRIPDELEAFPFKVPERPPPSRIEWLVDGEVIGATGPGVCRFAWPLSRGAHLARARVWRADASGAEETPEVRFTVE